MKKNSVSKAAFRLALSACLLAMALPFSGCRQSTSPDPASLESILVTKLPDKTGYVIGDEFDPAGLEITGTYSDGTTKLETAYILGAVDTGFTGTKTVTVSVKGKTASFDVVVSGALESIAISALPTKTVYLPNETFSPAGLEVTGTYSDGASKPAAGYTLSGVETGSLGTKTVTVSLNGKTASFDITVSAAPLSSIAVSQLPAKTSYAKGEEFDPAGLEITGTYGDGAEKIETGYTVDAVDTNSTGAKTVTVSLNEKTAAFTISVGPAVLLSIEISNGPAKTVYAKGESFNPAGLVVTGTYTDNPAKTETGYTLSAVDTASTGTKTVTVSLNAKTAAFTISVTNAALSSIAVTKMPTKTSYAKGVAFNPAGLEVTGTYTDNSTKLETGYSLSEVDTASVGTKTVTVTLNEKTASFDLTVNAAALVSIAVAQEPAKTAYAKGEAFDSAGLKIAGTYTDNSTKLETGYTLSAVDTASVGTKTVTVTLNEKTASFGLTVNAAALVSIAVTQGPSKIAYAKGEAFNPAGLEVTGYYTDSSTKLETGYALSAVDTASVGTKTVTVAFEGKTATFSVTVNNAALTSIAVSQGPAKTVYAKGEPFDVSGLAITGTYSDSTQKIETDYVVGTVGTNSLGTKTVTVSLNGKTTAFAITVNAAALTSIAVTQGPSKTAYYIGEALDTAGLIVTGTYTDSTAKPETGYTVGEVYTGSAGTQTVTVTLNGKTASFEVIFTAAPVYHIYVSQGFGHFFPHAIVGYGPQPALSVTITGQGNQATGALTVALSGTNSDSFTLSPTVIPSLAVGETSTFTVAPKTGLAAGGYAAPVTVSGGNGITATFMVSFTVDPVPTYGISLDVTESHTFPAAIAGYEEQAAKSVTITNTGNMESGPLTAALSGTGSDSFALSTTTISSIWGGGHNAFDPFTVAPKTGRAAGTYTATVTVSGGNAITANFDVSFTVNPMPTYTVTWKNYDGTTLDTDTLNYGSTPAYTGVTPTRAADTNYTYTFTGWSPAIAAVSTNTTYTAQFAGHALSNISTISFGGGPQAENLGNLGNPTASIDWSDSGSLTAAVAAGTGVWANGAAFIWYMDGAALSGQTNDSITIHARNYVPGTHTLAVKVTKGGESYSKTVVFTITE
jgi:hypothetical protein